VRPIGIAAVGASLGLHAMVTAAALMAFGSQQLAIDDTAEITVYVAPDEVPVATASEVRPPVASAPEPEPKAGATAALDPPKEPVLARLRAAAAGAAGAARFLPVAAAKARTARRAPRAAQAGTEACRAGPGAVVTFTVTAASGPDRAGRAGDACACGDTWCPGCGDARMECAACSLAGRQPALSRRGAPTQRRG